MSQSSPRTLSGRPEAVRALLTRKSLADARHRAAAARLLGLGETDVLALQLLAWAGALTPSRLGAQLRLTSGGTTALLHRLERASFVSREPHPDDRRSSLVRLTPTAEREAGRVWAPLVADLDAAAEELGEHAEAAAALLERVAAVAERHADHLARAAEAERPQVPAVPVPGLWA